MSICLGVIPLNNKSINTEQIKDFKSSALRSLDLVRFTSEVIQNEISIFQYDVKVFDCQFLHQASGDIAVLNGQPLLASNGPTEVEKDLTLLIQNKSSLVNLLTQSRGSFSGVCFDKQRSNAYLFTDKVGIRPIFYLMRSDALFFSSNFAVLKDYFYDDLTVCPDGVKEYLTLGYSFQDRTAFNEIKRLEGGQLLSVSSSVSLSQYWDWSCHEHLNFGDDNYKKLFDIFQQSVELRLFDNKQCYSFLSGGMDSRVVTSSLVAQGKELTSFNFQTSHCQDTEYSKMYAEKAGIKLKSKIVPKNDFFGWSRLIAKFIAEEEQQHIGQYVWSGDGGAPLGGVYLSEEVLYEFEQTEEAGVEKFLNFNNKMLPHNFFAGELQVKQNDELIKSFTKSLKVFEIEKTKSLFHFLLVNNQARALQYHHETIHHHKVELALPFFDAEFISHIFQLPMSEILYHRGYTKWFYLFPEFTRQTPWQTYPDHQECPIKYSDNLAYQWKIKQKNIFARNADLKATWQSINNIYTKKVVNRRLILFKMLLHLLGMKDSSYIVPLSTKLKNLLNPSAAAKCRNKRDSSD